MTLNAPLDVGQAALQRGAWSEAFHAFEAALVEQPDRAEALEGHGLAAWWLDLSDVVFASRERAYRAYRARGDEVSAARVAVWLAWDHDAFRGEYAITSGWLHRARELLDNWETSRLKFVKVFPHEYKRALGELHAQKGAKAQASRAQAVSQKEAKPVAV